MVLLKISESLPFETNCRKSILPATYHTHMPTRAKFGCPSLDCGFSPVSWSYHFCLGIIIKTTQATQGWQTKTTRTNELCLTSFETQIDFAVVVWTTARPDQPAWKEWCCSGCYVDTVSRPKSSRARFDCRPKTRRWNPYVLYGPHSRALSTLSN